MVKAHRAAAKTLNQLRKKRNLIYSLSYLLLSFILEGKQIETIEQKQDLQ